MWRLHDAARRQAGEQLLVPRALQAEGGEVTTVEGLSSGRELKPAQTAFLVHGGVQCGFCTPGMLISATALLRRTRARARTRCGSRSPGNLCRCTGYDGIVKAVLAAAGPAGPSWAGSGRARRGEQPLDPIHGLGVREAAEGDRGAPAEDVLGAPCPLLGYRERRLRDDVRSLGMEPLEQRRILHGVLDDE